MNIEEYRDFCLSLKGAKESLPFGPTTLVFKIGSKIFSLCGIDDEKFEFNLKNLPSKNIELCEKYPFIKPGYHMNKTHWITVEPQANYPKEFYFNLIKESYDIVFNKSLTKSEKEEISN